MCRDDDFIVGAKLERRASERRASVRDGDRMFAADVSRHRLFETFDESAIRRDPATLDAFAHALIDDIIDRG